MITYKKGNILESQMHTLVNPVNCDGIMGKGLALAFRVAFPKNFVAYKRECRDKTLRPGGFISVRDNGKVIVNLATKDHWRNPSKYEWIEAGLGWIAYFAKNGEGGIAIPALGCGLGGLDWNVVKPMMEKAFDFPECCEIEIYEPQ
jgi:O-acetyl-ADP-ribose deacetylase (regulator of RNase III)